MKNKKNLYWVGIVGLFVLLYGDFSFIIGGSIEQYLPWFEAQPLLENHALYGVRAQLENESNTIVDSAVLVRVINDTNKEVVVSLPILEYYIDNEWRPLFVGGHDLEHGNFFMPQEEGVFVSGPGDVPSGEARLRMRVAPVDGIENESLHHDIFVEFEFVNTSRHS